jgi:molybdate transport system regulatory protein
MKKASRKHKTHKKTIIVRPRFRILYGSEIAIGPGKADLLRAIYETGSIGQAAKRLNMSYMRAWKLVQTANRCFREPLVSAIRGGYAKGGTKLTPTGLRVLKIYQQLENKSLLATQAIWKQILELLK